MEEIRRHMTGSGAESLTLGILTLLFGVTVGVLGIVNGARLLRVRRELE